MKNITFLHPEFFWLFGLIPIAIFWYVYKRNQQTATLTIGSIKSFEKLATLKTKLYPILNILRILGLSFIIIALARPRTVDITSKSKTSKGIDIVMAMDVSGSMLAKDLKPNRMEALKKVAKTFVQDRINDRIGIVVYAAESYTRTPITSDKTIILNTIDDIYYDDSILKDGTGIGVGLATAINRVKDSKAKSKIIILLTDGVNNSGTIDPRMAAEIAKEYNIKVYTVGIGSNGQALFPYAKAPNGEFLYQMMNVEIDEKLMKEIARITDGKYFRATSNQRLKEIYTEINKLETTEITETKYSNYDEKFRIFLWIAFGLLLTEIIARITVYRNIL